MKYVPKNLQPYKRLRDYAGPDYYDYYPVAGQSRDSDVLERSNFRSILKALGGEKNNTINDRTPQGPVLVIRDSHWAVGWVETIYVSKTATATLKKADDIVGGLESYPVVDDDDFSMLEMEEANTTWMECYDLRERIALCAENGLSIFQARLKYCPSNENGEYLCRP